MTRHILITEDNKRDNISVYHQDPVILILANREDLLSLKKISYSNHNGIYILIGDEEVYIGQASGSIRERLLSHHKDKPWWNRLVLFTRGANDFGKDQTDYMEKSLIELYKTESNYHIINKTKGNISHVNMASKMIADHALEMVFNILENVANINILERLEEGGEEQPVTVEKQCDYQIIIQDKTKIFGTSVRNVYLNFVLYLLKNPHYKNLLLVEGAPLSKTEGNQGKYLGTRERISPGGQKLTKEILPDCHLYTNFSNVVTIKSIHKIAQSVDLKIQLRFP